jgi:hypothetical protein
MFQIVPASNVYTLTTSIFRQELKRIIIQSYRRLYRQRQTRVTTVITNTIQTTRNFTA